jgi:3-oxoacyl-(acyl-carrier-protein) synthase III
MSGYGVSIKSASYSLPDRVVDNDHEIFSDIPNLPENWWWFWGINSRKMVNEGGSELSLACDACNKAMHAANIEASDIDLVLSNTTNFFLTALDDEEAVQKSKRRIYPRLSTSLKHALRLDNAYFWDVEAACASFLFSLQLAANFIKQGRYRTVLVCSSEQMSAMLDFTSKSSTTFGDGAAAAVLTRSDPEEANLLSSYYYSNSQNYHIATGRWRYPENLPIEKRRPDDFSIYFTLEEDGQQGIARMMPETVPKVTQEALKKAGMTTDDIRSFIFHQPSAVLVDTWANQLGIEPERYQTKLSDCGCLVSASVGVTLCEAITNHQLAQGDHIVLAGAGSGWSFGAQVWRVHDIATI